MLDEELVVQGLNALFITSALMLQDAHQTAVGRLPEDAEGRMEMAARLSSAVRRISILASAGEVLAGSGGEGHGGQSLKASPE